MAKCILMRQEQKAATQTCAAQKGAQYKTAFGRGCVGYAGQGDCDSAGTAADNTQACHLIEGICAQHLLADKGYDSN